MGFACIIIVSYSIKTWNYDIGVDRDGWNGKDWEKGMQNHMHKVGESHEGCLYFMRQGPIPTKPSPT